MGKGTPNPGEVQPQGRKDTISKSIPGQNEQQCKIKWGHSKQVLRAANAESPWSKAEIQSLYDLFKEDRDWEAISQKLGRSTGACILQLDEYFTGLSHRRQWPWTQNEDRLLAALWQHGMSFDTMSRYFKDRDGQACCKRWNKHVQFRRDYQVPWSRMEDLHLLSLGSLPAKGVYMPSNLTINGHCIRRPYLECNRHKAELKNPAHKSVSILKISALDASESVKSNPWTEHGEKQLVDLYKAEKNWHQICLLLQEDHTAADCRSYWLEHYWDLFHKLMVDGELDVAGLERRGLKARETMTVEEEKEEEEEEEEEYGKKHKGHKMNREGAAKTKKGKEVDGHGNSVEEEDDRREGMEGMEGMIEHDDEADGEGDTDEDDRQEEMVEYDGEADAEGETDEDVADATYR